MCLKLNQLWLLVVPMMMNALIIPHVKTDFASTPVHTEILVHGMLTARLWHTSLYAPALMGTLAILELNASCVRKPGYKIWYYLELIIIITVHCICFKHVVYNFCLLSLLFTAPPEPECRIDPDCPQTKACIRNECVNPCRTTTCGINAECRVNNHRALCICRPGYEGDPYEICEERKLHGILIFS